MSNIVIISGWFSVQ